MIAAASFGLAASLSPLHAQGVSVLGQQPTRMGAFETGNMYDAGTFELDVGARQTSPDSRAGTGNQVYHGGGSYAFTDRFAMGVDVQNYIDPIAGPVDGYPVIPNIETTSLAVWGKFQLIENDRWSIAALASAESFLSMKSHLWGSWNTEHKNIGIAAFKAPITYSLSPKWQLHLTPSVTVAPDTLGGDQFYGTIFSVGAGVSYKPNERVVLFGSVETPISGQNTLATSGDWVQKPVWTAGGRYNITPRVALEGYLTNGFGTTPATSIMTFWPGGEHILAGGRIVYTPGAKRPESYRTLSLPPQQRHRNLQQDGFTLGAADTLEPGYMRTDLWYGTDNSKGASFGFSPDRDIELQFLFEEYSDNPTAQQDLVPTTNVRYMIGPKLRFLDQNNGDAFSLSGRMLYGRQISSVSVKVGVFYTDLIANYKTAGGLSFTATPKIAAFGNKELIGLGMGVNYAFGNGLEALAEITPIGRDGDEPTWAAGLRYHLGKSGFSVDAQATNAIGRHGIGSMVAQDDTRFALTLSKTFNLNGLKFY